MVAGIAKSPLEKNMIDSLEPRLLSQGYRLVDVDCRSAATSLVRLFVEPVGSVNQGEVKGGGTTVEDCAAVSRWVGEWLEGSDWFAGEFDLEVSSPGIDRRLRLQEDFEAHLSEVIKLKLWQAKESLGKSPRGRLHGVTDAGLSLEVDRRVVPLVWAEIQQANLVWEKR